MVLIAIAIATSYVCGRERAHCARPVSRLPPLNSQLIFAQDAHTHTLARHYTLHCHRPLLYPCEWHKLKHLEALWKPLLGKRCHLVALYAAYRRMRVHLGLGYRHIYWTFVRIRSGRGRPHSPTRTVARMQRVHVGIGRLCVRFCRYGHALVLEPPHVPEGVRQGVMRAG
eukprot:scaffold1691_cov107-Isochrysis_galbana.AAC.11